jgi:hypothetical protein
LGVVDRFDDRADRRGDRSTGDRVHRDAQARPTQRADQMRHHVRVKRMEHGGDREEGEITAEDRPRGFPAAELEQLFDQDRRGDDRGEEIEIDQLARETQVRPRGQLDALRAHA